MLLGAPNWALGTAMPMFDPSLIEVRAQALNGLGLTRARWAEAPTTTVTMQSAGLGRRGGEEEPTLFGLGRREGEEEPTLHGLGLTRTRWIEQPHGLGFFESPLWMYRKWIVLGGVGLLGLGILGLAGALLK